jgi:hypothetical protein
MHGGERIQVNVIEQGNPIEQWVRKGVEPPLLFDPRKERYTHNKSRKQLLET